jgi:hypothetical protein
MKREDRQGGRNSLKRRAGDRPGTLTNFPPLLRERARSLVIGAACFIMFSPEHVIGQCNAAVIGASPTLEARNALGKWLDCIAQKLPEACIQGLA